MTFILIDAEARSVSRRRPRWSWLRRLHCAYVLRVIELRVIIFIFFRLSSS